jgi:MFS family permease
MVGMTSKEKSILLAVSICHALIHCYMLVFPTIYDKLGASLGLKFAGVGFVGMASYMAFGFGALPSGLLADRLGAGRLLAVCLGGTTAASVVAFLARTPAGVVAALILLGLFASLYHPAGLTILSVSMKNVGKSLGVHGMAGTLGVAVAPVIAGTITANAGWRYAYLTLGGVGLAVMVFVFSVSRSRFSPPDHRGEEVSFSLSVSRELLMIYVIGAVYGLIYRGIMTFFPTYLASRIGFIGDDVERLGLLSSGILVVSVIGPLVGGHLASSKGKIWRNLLLVFTALGFLGLGFYFLRGIALILVAAPTVLLIFGFQPLQNTLLAKCSHQGRRGSVYGINFTVSFGIGAFASGIGGLFGERFGLRSIFLLMIGLCAVELVLIAASRYMQNRSNDDGLSKL